MSQVIEIRRAEQLDRYRLAWSLLESRADDASFYRSWDWTRLWLRERHGFVQPRVLIVYSGTEIVGILPLCQTIRRSFLGKLRVLSYPTEPGVTDCGPVGPNPMATLMGAMRYLSDRPSTWQLLELREHAAARPLRRMAHTALQQAHLPMSVRSSNALSTIEFSSLTHLAVLGRCSTSDDDSELRFVRVRPPGSCQGDGYIAPELIAACRQTAKRTRTDKALQSPGRSRLINQDDAILRAAANRGALDVALAYRQDQPVAFAIHFCQNGDLHHLASGCDVLAGGLGAKRFLWTHLVHDSMERKDRLALFSTEDAHAMPDGLVTAKTSNVEIVRSLSGWRSQILSRHVRDRLFHPSDMISA